MFLEKTSQQVKGYYEIQIFGFFVERFLNLLSSKKINAWDIKKIDDATAIFKTDRNGYKCLASIASKTGCKYKIIKRVGAPFYLKKHKKRHLFLIMFIVAIFGIYIYNLHIWQIEIIGNFNFPIESIKHELDEEKIKIGTLKSSLNLDYIKNNIYMRRYDIAWIGIRFKGTKCIVEIVEANLKKQNPFDNTPCDVVANKSGKVVSVKVVDGEPKIQSGDMVNSGDVLISGKMESNWGTTHLVSADGEIYIKTWYMCRKIVPMERDIVSPTGKKHKNYVLKIENYKINFGNTSTNFEKCDTIMSDSNLSLFGIINLPIELQTTTCRELDVETVKYTENQAISYAIKELENTLKNKMDDNIKIVNRGIKTSKGNYGIMAIVTYECIEKVGIKVKLEG